MNASANKAVSLALDRASSALRAVLAEPHKLDPHVRRYLEGQVEEFNNMADELDPKRQNGKPS